MAQSGQKIAFSSLLVLEVSDESINFFADFVLSWLTFRHPLALLRLLCSFSNHAHWGVIQRTTAISYRIAGNFRGRKLSRRKFSRNAKIGRIMGVACLEFRGENFRGWLKNREIRESFLLRKFPRYTVPQEGLLGTKSK